MIQDYDPVRVDDGVDTVCDRDDGSILENATAESELKKCVCLNVYRCLSFK
jgi:hypothetical protein